MRQSDTFGRMILVTGSTGLLGSHLILHLLEQGKAVRGLYRSKSKKESLATVFRYHVSNADELLDRVEWVEGDVLNIPSLEDALEGVTQVYHCAATVSFSPKDRAYMFRVNVEGTANVVNLCLEKEQVKLCHVSSVAAIGRDETDELIDESREWKASEHNSSYAVSKHRAELEVWRGVVEGLNAVIVNPSMILGPGDWDQSSATLFKKVWTGLPFYTRGGNCFVDVRDVAASMVELMASDVSGERFIIGAENRSYKDVFERIAAHMGRKPPRMEAPEWMLEVGWRALRVLSAVTGTKPFVTKETVRNAMKVNRYDKGKLLRTLPSFHYRKVNDSLAFVSSCFMADQGRTRRS